MGRAAPAALAETVALKMMVAVSAEAEELSRLDLAHCRIVDLHSVRY